MSKSRAQKLLERGNRQVRTFPADANMTPEAIAVFGAGVDRAIGHFNMNKSKIAAFGAKFRHKYE